jgi:hypothetical protein
MNGWAKWGALAAALAAVIAFVATARSMLGLDVVENKLETLHAIDDAIVADIACIQSDVRALRGAMIRIETKLNGE